MGDGAAVAPSVGSAIREATAMLSAAGCDSPRLDAELLLGSVLKVDRSRLIVDNDRQLDQADAAHFAELLARRAAREPVAYILGFKDFRWISVAVDRRVLIPRPETELLVEVGLTLPDGARVVDVGTGSGAVALALKHERSDLDVVGIDMSPDAIAVARDNAARLGLEVRFLVADLLDGGPYDGVLANLPYVPDGVSLPPEIELYEPALALHGGPDGLDLARRLVSSVSGAQVVALEIGFGQEGAVGGLLADTGFGSVERLRDLAGHERVVVGRR